MQTETATLLAVLAAPLALLAAVLAMATVVAMRRGRRRVVRLAARLEAQEARIRNELAAARRATSASGSLLAQAHAALARLDSGVVAWTVALSDQRAGLQRLTRGRVRPVVRALQVAGALARIALLWRAPVR